MVSIIMNTSQQIINSGKETKQNKKIKTGYRHSRRVTGGKKKKKREKNHETKQRKLHVSKGKNQKSFGLLQVFFL